MYTPKEPDLRQATKRPEAALRSRSHGGSLLDLVSDDSDDFNRAEYARTSAETARTAFLPGRQQETIAEQINTRPTPAPVKGQIMGHLAALRAIGPDDVFQWLKDGLRWIVGATVLCLAAALVYALTAQPRYTVYTDLVIDPANLQVVNDDVFGSNPLRDSQLLEVESKLRILTSRNVLTRVIDTMKLTDDTEFVKPDIFAAIKQLFSSTPEDETARGKMLTAMRALAERVEARREERSFVVSLGVYTDDPQKSVTLSDAIVSAFETEIFESAAQSAGRVATTLNQRLEELRRNVTDAEAKVEEFKRQKGLQSSNGELVSTQLAAELNTQVLTAQQRYIELETRYKQMQDAISTGRASSASVFASPAMTTLRQDYDAAVLQLNSLTLTYGTRHPRITAANSDLSTLKASITNEAKRIADTALGDMKQAKSTLDALQGKATEQQSTVYMDNDSQVQLRDLERDARAKAALYETHLTRAQQITEQQQINTSNIRVISRAMPPKSRSWPPRTLLLLAAGAFAGIAIGIGLAVLSGMLRVLRQNQPHAG
ncbi:cell shape-determining protein [Pararhizobium polonicum]|uniref:Cell shape-determining protein n=1 Tax=Pararhizobium polonicum TaxID=1612624 RepID=A0A1C7P1I7_9HYPH|nr:GumC family protein [Pararhizobium polonicum]OBZ95143.1 cell shape-determining protein [Pararhizobium polonicum]